MALKYLPCPWVLFEYWKCDKFEIISREKCVKNDDNYIRGKIKKGGEKNSRVESWNNNYVLLPLTAMPMPTIMGMLKMQLSPATIYAPGRGLWRP